MQKSGFEKLYSLITLIAGGIGDNSFALFYTSGDAEVRMKGSNKEFRVTRGSNIVRGCLAKIEF